MCAVLLDVLLPEEVLFKYPRNITGIYGEPTVRVGVAVRLGCRILPAAFRRASAHRATPEAPRGIEVSECAYPCWNWVAFESLVNVLEPFFSVDGLGNQHWHRLWGILAEWGRGFACYLSRANR
jgi:hypothetical protein